MALPQDETTMIPEQPAMIDPSVAAAHNGYVQPVYPAAETNGAVPANGAMYAPAPMAYTAPAYVPPAPAPAPQQTVLPLLTPEEYNAFLVNPVSPWPPPIFVRRNVNPEERFYLDNRWYSQWKFFDKKATENKNKYHRLQLIIGIGSVAVPVLVGLNATDPVGQQILYWATVVISLAVAISAAVENIKKYGDNWRSYRRAAEELQQEKSLYDVKAGRYTGNSEPFIRFAERCEEIIARQNGQFMQTVEKQTTQATEQNAELLDKYRAESQGQMTTFGTGGMYTVPTGGMFATDVAAAPNADPNAAG